MVNTGSLYLILLEIYELEYERKDFPSLSAQSTCPINPPNESLLRCYPHIALALHNLSKVEGSILSAFFF